MISANDFVAAEFSDDLIAAGISVCRARMPWLGTGLRARPYVGLRRRVAAVAVALALRRYLSQKKIAYAASPRHSFNSAEVGLLVGGTRWHINSYLISQPDQIAALDADSGLALTALALIPLEDRWRERYSDDDLHVFAMSTGRARATRIQGRSASRPPAREFLVHLMPLRWAQPRHWRRIGPVVVKYESPEELTVELGGHNEAGEFLVQSVRLASGARREVRGDFCSVTHIHARSRPTGRIGVNWERGHRGYVIDPEDWTDLWIHGSKILLLGWMRHYEFRHRAKPLSAGTRVFQFSRTRAVNMAVPVEELKPLARLIEPLARSSPGS